MAAPAFGYRAERHYESGRAVGTSWHIVPEEAKIVQRMYEMRRDGAAFDKIARWLNETAVPTARGGRLWRSAGVQRMLSNAVYRGEVAWTEESLDPASVHGKSTKEHFFERPHLRIVTDELWHCGQSSKVSRSGYGGGRQAYSGILKCGHCGNLLSSTAKGKAFTCGSCNSNRLVGDPQVLAVPTISVAGLNAVLSFALERVLNDERIEALRARLRERLAQGADGELAELRKTRDRLVKVGQHLLRLIYQREQPDPLLDEEYAKNSKSVADTERQIKALEATKVSVARRDIAAQLDVDPRALTEKLLDGKLPPEHLRAALAKLFPRFVFLGRESRYIARFEIEFAPGAAVAWLSDSAPILDERAVIRVRLIGSARRPVVWNVIEESVEVGELATTSELAETAHVMDEDCAIPA
ncbi:recombinase family protein [Thauera humireducens]|uniref:recombinase family protein n=1 Tax=Thauera humireducens TaxID=1134435 RepID=UPI003C796F5F